MSIPTSEQLQKATRALILSKASPNALIKLIVELEALVLSSRIASIDKQEVKKEVERILDPERIAKLASEYVEIPMDEICERASKLVKIPEQKIINQVSKKVEIPTAEIVDKVLKLIPPPEKGKDADEEKIKAELEEVLIAELPKFGEQYRNALEILKDDERLDKSAIKDLDEEIARLEKKISSLPTSTSGGVTNARIQQAFKYILKTEAPVGDIDGVNTEYTVSQPIFAVLTFSLSGEVIPQIPNYTISGNKITFGTALPSAYSGTDFEIKYI